MRKNLKRKLFSAILPFVANDEMIVITGMRRVGKSSLLQMLFDAVSGTNKLKFDIENPIERAVFEEKDYKNIIKNFYDLGIKSGERIYIFLDEIQSYPNIVLALKYLYDHYRIKFFLTGSSSFYLKNLFPESLSGRKFEFEMFPLDFDEFMYFKNVIEFQETKTESPLEKGNSKILYESYIRWYDEYLLYGGFPQVVLATNNETRQMYLRDIFKSYFQTDLLQLTNMKNVSHLRDLIVLLASRIGNKVDITRLASELGLNRETIYNYLGFLTGSYMFHFVSRYGKNTDKEISSLKKVYMCDTGLAAQLTRLSDGQLLENATYLNLRKYGNVQYYHDKNQKEIDFVLPEHKLALEVKRTAIKTDVNRLNSFATTAGLKNSKTITYKHSELQNTWAACLV